MPNDPLLARTKVDILGHSKPRISRIAIRWKEDSATEWRSEEQLEEFLEICGPVGDVINGRDRRHLILRLVTRLPPELNLIRQKLESAIE